MKVTLISRTEWLGTPEELDGTEFYNWDMQTFEKSPAERLIHFAGRGCYESWKMPNPGTATDEGYVSNIIDQGHESVLEHASFGFYVTGVSRNLTHELIRHRHLSYSEKSQRFVNMEDAKFVVPPAVRSHYDENDPNFPVNGMQPLEVDSIEQVVYRTVVQQLEAAGATRKQAREAARYYLPSGMETRIVVTGNIRAWRDMLKKRWSVHADAEIREFAGKVLEQLRLYAPTTVKDIPNEPFE